MEGLGSGPNGEVVRRMPDDPEYTPQEAAAFGVDQVVADGELDDPTQRVNLMVLRAIAFKGYPHRVPKPVSGDFAAALKQDYRFIEFNKGSNKYRFEPVILHDTSVVPSDMAIVRGTAHCTPEERQAVMEPLNQFAQEFLDSRGPDSLPLTIKQVQQLCMAAGAGAPDGIREYMVNDTRFLILNPDKVIPNGLYTPRDHLTLFEPGDFTYQLADKAVRMLSLVMPAGAFTPHDFMGTIERMGVRVLPECVAELREKLEDHDNIRVLPNGNYLYRAE